MKKQNEIKLSKEPAAVYGIILKNDSHALVKELNNNSQLIKLSNYEVDAAIRSLKPIKNQPIQKSLPLLLKNNLKPEPALTNNLACKSLFRFFVKNGEHVYGRSNDIIMIESCDHLANVYLAFNDKIKKTIRTNTLKDFLSLLPADQFARISRFCAVNISRLSGGSFIDQTFEFDFRISVKLKHALPQHVFKNIGK
jgi:DNA-binding LytR/AlgR family response regulator